MWRGYTYACAYIKKHRPRCSSLPNSHITARYTTTFHLYPQEKYDPPCVNFHRTHKGSTSLCAKVLCHTWEGRLRMTIWSISWTPIQKWLWNKSTYVKGHSSSMYCKNNAWRWCSSLFQWRLCCPLRILYRGQNR